MKKKGYHSSSWGKHLEFEVEREILAYSDVREVACVPAPGEASDEEVKVFVISSDTTNWEKRHDFQIIQWKGCRGAD